MSGERYRYTLSRDWLDGEGTVLFVMLNPSTADEREDDPTIRRCIGFAQRWGYGRLEVANLYALRSTDPRGLFVAADPVGPENDQHLHRLICRARLIVAAWGAAPHPQPGRVGRLCDLLDHYARPVHCIGLTKDGHPRHPLYVRRDAGLIRFPTARTIAADLATVEQQQEAA